MPIWVIALQCSAVLSFNLNVLYAEGIIDGQYPLLCGNTISKGFQRPRNKQGIHDQRFYDDVRPLVHFLLATSQGVSSEV